mmetsp:Transcript_12152/g.36622  ORF Transcript_12152/g.36622 Transcript_12152/m.36622 type:complete len:282 (+) Transcript_12152:1337-2182(+)
MAEGHLPHGLPLPGHLLRHLLRVRRHALAVPVDGRRADLDLGCALSAVVRHFRPSRLPRRVPGLPQRTDRVPRQILEHSAPDPRRLLVRLAALHGRRRRRPALRRLLRRALLHPVVHVDGPVLLRLRLHAPRLPHSLPHVRRNHHGPPLLPALRRGLPLVVAHLLNVRLHRRLRLPLLGLLLLQTRIQHAPHLRPLLRLHAPRQLRPLPPHRHRRLLLRPLVQHHHLLLHQGRLIDQRVVSFPSFFFFWSGVFSVEQRRRRTTSFFLVSSFFTVLLLFGRV